MAPMASAARDIPKGPHHRDNLTVVAAGGDSATVARSRNLPTPPNSISPALPAHGLKAQLQKARLEPIDSDLDLHDEADGMIRSASASLEDGEPITSTMLANDHLPGILLNHGPLAIRHIMGYLTASVPGFSAIPPTKARRLVVSSLEGKGGGKGGDRGQEGEVEFEKIGWGRWDARRRGQAARDRQGTPPPDEESSLSGGIPISQTAGRLHDRPRIIFKGKGNAPEMEPMHFSHQEDDILMVGDEADQMSLDGSASASCSEAPDDDFDMNDDPEDATDDEDWAAMGAAALRAESYPSMGITEFDSTHPYNSCGLRSFSVASGMARAPQPSGVDFSALAGTPDAQEREAVEALLRLGSV